MLKFHSTALVVQRGSDKKAFIRWDAHLHPTFNKASIHYFHS